MIDHGENSKTTLNKAMPDVVVNFKQYETTFEIVDNMREGWQGKKGNHNLDEMKTKNVVGNMVVSISTQSLTVMGQLIGTNWRIVVRIHIIIQHTSLTYHTHIHT
jgi:hypothetical protein